MKIKGIAVILIFFAAFSVAYTQTDTELKRLKGEIEKLEKEIKAISGSKDSVSKEIVLIKAKQVNERKAVTMLSNSIESNNKKIKELTKQENDLRSKSRKYEAQVRDGMIFIINNSDLFLPRIFLSGSDGSQTVIMSEILTIINFELVERLDKYRKNLDEISTVHAKLVSENDKLKSNLESSKKLTAQYEQSEKNLSKKLEILKKDENAQKEYLKVLKKDQERIDKALKEGAKKKAVVGTSDFAKLRGKHIRPLDGTVIQTYGEKLVPEAGVRIMHKGIKIKPAKNGDVVSIADGTVVYIDNIAGMENIIIVQHDEEYYTVYANLDEFYMNMMDKIKKGETLGRINVDLKGNSAYLYFEIRKGEEALNPAIWLKK